MKSELINKLLQLGWDEVYERFIKDLAPTPNARGERRACSPFPDTIDRNASFSLNVQSGLWNCFKTDRGGDYIRFRSIMDADEFDSETGLAIEDYGRAERTVMQEMGLTKSIDTAWVDACRDLLYNDLAIRHRLQSIKPWNHDLMYQLKIGYSPQHDRFVIPIFNRNGSLINCRMYRPGHDPKMIWLESNAGGNFLWPHVGWREKSCILVEGEPDAISLRSLGFPALTGTLGKGSPVPDGEWWRDRAVYVLMDDDPAGHEATIEACRRLRDLAAEVHVVKLPAWTNKPTKADISDYIVFLYINGYALEQVQRSVSELLVNAERVESPKTLLDTESVQTTFAAALTSIYLNKRVKFVARVTAKSTSKFLLPIAYTCTCPAEGHSYCKKCPMQQNFHGNARFIHDPRSIDSLKLIQTTDEIQQKVFKEMHGIPSQCPDPKIKLDVSIDVEAAIINSSVSEGEVDDEDYNDRQRREAYILVHENERLEENRDYTFEGFVYAHPSSQRGVFLIDQFSPHESIYDNFKHTDETLSALTVFQPSEGQSVVDKLVDVATDLADSVSMILGRLDLHLAYRTVWHSALAFIFSGKYVHRGWIEALVLGDTRCIDGDSILHINRGGNGRQYSIKDTYIRFNQLGTSQQNWKRSIPTYCRSWVNGELRQHLVKDVVFNGIKPVVKLMLASGKMLRMTPDHEVLLPSEEWIQVQNLKPGDYILSNGWNNVDSTKGSNNGNWKGGKSYHDGYILVSGCHGHPSANRHGQVLEHLLVVEARIGRPVLKDEKVHHKDGNRSNNEDSNLIFCSNQAEHTAHHPKTHQSFHGSRNACFIPVMDRIVSIEPDGETEVFDLIMDNPHRNFIANGIIVHNCGKSETFRQLSSFYGLGVLIDCKMQSVPGILGTVVQMSSGEYYVVAGMLPQQDGKVICFDEFTVPRHVGQSIIEILSSTRSEGIVRINKAASAEFKARVRSIWLANPGGGKLIAQVSDSGVELINRLIPQPEDIARFDLALTVSQEDVPAEVINNIRRPSPPRYTKQLSRILLAWIYSRKPYQIHFTEKAEGAIIDLAIRMHKKYDSSIPLVEIADQRTRVAKLSVSVAGQCFSTDDNGETIIVTEQHVEAVERLYATWYDKPVMGYNVYSERMKVDCQLLNQHEIQELFDTTISPHGFRLAEELMRLDEITEKSLGTIIPVESMFQRSILQILYKNRAMHLVQRGKRDAYERTPAFTSFLKHYLSNVNANHPTPDRGGTMEMDQISLQVI